MLTTGRSHDIRFSVVYPLSTRALDIPTHVIIAFLLKGAPSLYDYSGYLWKKSTNLKKDWKRRWFFIEVRLLSRHMTCSLALPCARCILICWFTHGYMFNRVAVEGW